MSIYCPKCQHPIAESYFQEHSATCRIGDWTLTYTGRKFWPLDPRQEEISVEDIAHHLALTCRFGGACREFYSVAQHSVLVAQQLPVELQLDGLLHDATEAYIGDMIRPLKYCMPSFQEAEARLWAVVASKFGLSNVEGDIHPDVKHWDNVLLITEKRDLLPNNSVKWALELEYEPLSLRITPWKPAVAEEQFLLLYHSLSKK